MSDIFKTSSGKNVYRLCKFTLHIKQLACNFFCEHENTQEVDKTCHKDDKLSSTYY